MRVNGHILLVIAAGLLAIVIGWFYQAQLKEREVPIAELEIPDNIDYYFTDMTYRAMKNSGEPDYVFTSPRLEHQVRGDTSHIETPEVTIFGNDNRWQVVAEQGQLFHQTEVLQLQNQVVMKKQGNDPMRLESELAVFEAKDEMVRFPQEVLITFAEARISAASASFDIKNNVFRFQKTRTVYQDETS